MSKNIKEKISIVVPCYNEQESIPLFYDAVKIELKKIPVDYELLFVNDGSKDNTLKELKDLAKKDKKVKFFSFSRNFGKESAMYCGLKNSTGNYVVIMDADLQHKPTLLLEMLNKVQNDGYDSVAVKRVDRKGESIIRSFLSRKFYNLMNKMSDTEVVQGGMDFRLMNRKMVDAVLSISEYNRFTKGIFSWVGFKTYWLETENTERVAGTSSWNMWGLVKYAIEGIVNFSNAPLNLAAYLGTGLTFAGFIYLIVIVVKYLLVGDPVQGWATIMCVIIISSGVQLLSLGIMGQYIGKTYMETKNRPIYILDETNSDQK